MKACLSLNPNMHRSYQKIGLDGKSHARTPMSTSVKLGVDLAGKSVDQTLYGSIIGSLLYFKASRPYISFSVGVCARFQANPKESYMTTIKRILNVNIIVNYSVWYSRDTNLDPVGYSDANWADNVDDRKSTSGGRLFLCWHQSCCTDEQEAKFNLFIHCWSWIHCCW